MTSLVFWENLQDFKNALKHPIKRKKKLPQNEAEEFIFLIKVLKLLPQLEFSYFKHLKETLLNVPNDNAISQKMKYVQFN